MNKSLIGAVLFSAVGLYGCSQIASLAGSAIVDSVTGGDKPALGVDTEVVAGDKSQTVQVGDSVKAPVKFDDISVKDGGNMSVNTTTNTAKKKQSIDASSASHVTVNNADGLNPIWWLVIVAIFGGLCFYVGLLFEQRDMLMRKKSK